MLYLDYNSTAPLVPKAKEIMLKLFADIGLNPSAIHKQGRKARAMLEEARRRVAADIGIPVDGYNDYKITFTSGATEANNIIINSWQDSDIFVSATEHSSILNFADLNNIKIIDVDSDGILNLAQLDQLLASSTSAKKLVSVAIANNETGVIAPISDIAKICHKHKATLHSDCAQAVGKIPCDVVSLGLDIATFSSHKFGGPTGAGFLVAKREVNIKAGLIGGGQEQGLRSGTENVAAILAMAEALTANIACRQAVDMQQRRNALEKSLQHKLPGIVIVGQNVARLPNTTMLILPGWKNQAQLIALDMQDVFISMGSACSSGKVKTANSLAAMGYSEEYAASAIRVSSGPDTTIDDINKFVEIYSKIAYIWQKNNSKSKLLETGS